MRELKEEPRDVRGEGAGNSMMAELVFS